MTEELIGGADIYDEDYRAVQERLRRRSMEAARMAESAAKDTAEISVLIVDDQELVRNGFRLILSSYEQIHVVGVAENGAEAYEKALELMPDVVLMDIRMPIENGIDATRRIHGDRRLEHTHIVVLTTFDIDEYVYDALSAGAAGFMLKDAEPDDIVAAIEAVSRGDALIQPSITRRLVETFVHTRAVTNREGTPLSELTEREAEILKMVAQGLNNDEIADQLVISPATVKTHVARIMSKTDSHDRAQLVVLAYECGVVVPGVK